MANFYLAGPLSPDHAGSELLLPASEGRHAARAARIRTGETTHIGDGRGHVAAAVVTEVQGDSVTVRLGEVRFVPAPDPRIWLVQALAKGDRDELAVQTATELGASVFVPWQARRSVVRWDARKAERGHTRWCDISREAGKQAMAPWTPSVLPPVGLDALAGLVRAHGGVLLDPGAADGLLDVVPVETTGDLLLIVGPEGGIDPAEIEQLVAAGARRARLGPLVLRTSSAGPAAIAALAPHPRLWG